MGFDCSAFRKKIFMMEKIFLWLYGVLKKRYDHTDEVKVECIAYEHYVSSRHMYGFPKSENNSYMDAWELYDHYVNKSDKRNTMIQWASRSTGMQNKKAISNNAGTGKQHLTVTDPYHFKK